MSKKTESKNLVTFLLGLRTGLRTGLGIGLGEDYPKVSLMEIFNIPSLRNPVMILAFEGWNDAGEAASGAIEQLLAQEQSQNEDTNLQLIARIESEEFYDFQVNRPYINVDDFLVRELTWPTTDIYAMTLSHQERDLIIVKGDEPSMRWRTFTSELLDLADALEVSLVLSLGSLLADVPHSRPISVNVTAAHPAIASRLGVENSTYEGPTGILGVISDACVRRGIDAVSMWAAVPHYASGAPSPKSSLALINALEDFLDISVEYSDLATAAEEWESEVSEMAREDSDVAAYVKALEESKDAAELPSVSGESIAKEFERYLRRRQQD